MLTNGAHALSSLRRAVLEVVVIALVLRLAATSPHGRTRNHCFYRDVGTTPGEGATFVVPTDPGPVPGLTGRRPR